MTTAKSVAAQLNLPPLAEASIRKNADHMMQVIAFHDTYGAPMLPLQSDDREFRHMDDARVAMRLGLIAEEFCELLEDGLGVTANITYGTPGTGHGYGGETLPDLIADGKRDGAAVADALGDIVYVCYSMALEMGYDLRAVIEEIHAANLTKLGDDGKPILREDGKVLKGPNYVKPNIPAALDWDVEA